MMKWLRKLLGKFDVVSSRDHVEKFACYLNDNFYVFSTKDEMLKFIDEYSKHNQIFSLTLLKLHLYNLTQI